MTLNGFTLDAVLTFSLDTRRDEGHDLLSPYVEVFWLPIVGPSSVCLLRHVARRLTTSPAWTTPMAELGQHIGLGNRAGRHAPIVRTLNRLANFNLIGIDVSGTEIFVPVKVPSIRRAHLDRLHPGLQQAHEAAGFTVAGTPERSGG